MRLLLLALTSVGLRELKAEPTEHRHEYEHKQDKASLPFDETQTSTRSTLYKTRSWVLIFHNRQILRALLIRICKSLGIKYRRVPLDQKTRWSSTERMIRIWRTLKQAIQSVQATQTLTVGNNATVKTITVGLHIYTAGVCRLPKETQS